MEQAQAPDGTRLAFSLRPGGRPVVLVHATGFCKETWDPVVESLPGEAILTIDQRGHGDSSVAEPPFDWWDLGGDVLTVLDRVGWERPVGVGHSSGAAALVLAELARPSTFARLLLIEPIIFPPPYVRMEDLPLAVAALKRRAVFPSRRAALESFAGRGPFERWDRRALEAYVDHGFRRAESGWELKCRPEVEAEFYRQATLHGAWDRLNEVTCPVVIAGGADSESHPAAFLEVQAARFPDAVFEIVPGATHFVPMEKPGAIANLVGRELDSEAGPRGGHPAV